jgi:hypothetical protein
VVGWVTYIDLHCYFEKQEFAKKKNILEPLNLKKSKNFFLDEYFIIIFWKEKWILNESIWKSQITSLDEYFIIIFLKEKWI